MELTAGLRKMIVSLSETKHRHSLKLFKAEGTKCVLDTFYAFKARYLIATQQWIDNNIERIPLSEVEVIKASPAEMGRVSAMSNPAPVVAVYEIPDQTFDISKIKGQLSLALDCVQDPGNLGTIIRTADWFGIRDIFCSKDTADVYNPKVVQATMGGISRVKVHYLDLCEFIARLDDTPVYGTFLDGQDISTTQLTDNGLIVMGNEGKGVSKNIAELVSHRLTIPSFPKGEPTSESLNVAVATAIVVSKFRLK